MKYAVKNSNSKRYLIIFQISYSKTNCVFYGIARHTSNLKQYINTILSSLYQPRSPGNEVEFK